MTHRKHNAATFRKSKLGGFVIAILGNDYTTAGEYAEAEAVAERINQACAGLSNAEIRKKYYLGHEDRATAYKRVRGQ